MTGASRGLGLAVTHRLLDHGYNVIATARKESEGLRQLRLSSPTSLKFAPFDLMEIADIKDFVREITTRYGAIFGLVNNAGIGLDGVLPTMHNSDIERIIRLNSVAPIILAKYACRSMMLSREGRIVNISSIIASTGFSGLAAYAASKASLEGFTRSLARELGRLNITVNAVAPGYMETEMTQGLQEEKLTSVLRRSPLRRLVKPDEVAEVVAFLLGAGASSITGSVVTVDAGSSC